MKKFYTVLVLLLVLTGGYYGFWRYQLSDDVARVEATIEHHNAEFRKHNRWVTLKADSVSPAGFPFASRVHVKRPTMTFVWGEETYGVSLPWAELSMRDAASGTYDVTYSPTAEAVYAKSGQAPEEYSVTPKETLKVLLRAQGDSRQCSPFPGGARCARVGVTDPLITYAVQVPESLTITMELNGKSKDAQFKMIPLNMPIFMTIPPEMDHPLELFIGMLREALIFNK